MAQGSLKHRITWAFVAWIAALNFVLIPVVFSVREYFAIWRIDDLASTEAVQVAQRIADGELPPADILAFYAEASRPIVPGADPFLYQVSNPDGSVVSISPPLRALADLPTTASFAPGRDIPTPLTRTYSTTIKPDPSLGRRAENFRLRIAQTRTVAPDGRTYHLLVAASLRTTDWLRRLLLAVLVCSLIPSTIWAGMAGWLVATRIARRLEGVAGAVRAVSPSRIDERIALPPGNDEIGRVASDINGMLDRIAVTYRAMERYMAEVSHELRTPVASLLAEAQVIKRADPTSKLAGSVEEEMRRLSRLIDSFLTLARFEHSTAFLASEPHSLNDAALESVQHNARFAQRSGVALAINLFDAHEAEQDPMVRADSELLRIAIDNVIRNAIQFSTKGGTVDIRIERAPGHATVAVRDHGPGIPSEFIERVFDRFFQAPGPRPTGRGLGLGLAIARTVVELHKGTIRAANHPEGGCEFTITLPLAPASASSTSAPSAASA